MKISRELISIATFAVLVYCCIGVDYLHKYMTPKVLNHPFTRFVVLALMALCFQKDHYLAIIIGFAYLLTKQYVGKKNSVMFNDKHTFVENAVADVHEREAKYVPTNNTEFTSDFQFTDAQSNVVSDEAIKTEVRTWPDGYGTQGGFAP